MRFVLYLLLCAPGILAVEEDIVEVPPRMLMPLRKMFHMAVKRHLQSEYVLLLPTILQQNETWNSCKQMAYDELPNCASCVETTCGVEYGERIRDEFEMLRHPGETPIDWKTWHDIGEELLPGMFDDDYSPDSGTFSGELDGGSPYGYRKFPKKRLLGAALAVTLGTLTTYELFKMGQDIVGNWGSITDTLGNIGSSIGSTLSDVGNTVFGWLGRRRRETRSTYGLLSMLRKHRRTLVFNSEDLKTCIDQCTECVPYGGQFHELISTVCGEHVLTDERNLVTLIKELKDLYFAIVDTENGTPLIEKITYNKNDFELSSMSYGGVMITARTPTGFQTYPSQVRFRRMFSQVSVVEMTEELVAMWGL